MYFQAIARSGGSYDIRLSVADTGDGLVAVLEGGDHPHVGGVSIASPRLSLTGTGAASCDISSITLPGHRDTVIAEKAARHICIATGKVVVACAGVHCDAVSEDEIAGIVRTCADLCECAFP